MDSEDPVDPNLPEAKAGLKKAASHRKGVKYNRETFLKGHKRTVAATRALEKLAKPKRKPARKLQKRTTIAAAKRPRKQETLDDILDRYEASTGDRRIPRQSTVGPNAAVDKLIDDALQGDKPPRVGDETETFGVPQPKGETLKMSNTAQTKALNIVVKQLLKLLGKTGDKALAKGLAVAFKKIYKGQDRIAYLSAVSHMRDKSLLKQTVLRFGEDIGKATPKFASLFKGWDSIRGTTKYAKIKRGDVLPANLRGSALSNLVRKILIMGKRAKLRGNVRGRHKEAATQLTKALSALPGIDKILTAIYIDERDNKGSSVALEVDSVLIKLKNKNPELAHLIPIDVRQRLAVAVEPEGPRAPKPQKRVPKAKVALGGVRVNGKEIKDPTKVSKRKLPKLDISDPLAYLGSDLEEDYGIKVPKRPTIAAGKDTDEELKFEPDVVEMSPKAVAELATEAFRKMDPDKVTALMIKFPANSAKNFMVYKALSGKSDRLSVLARMMVGTALKNGKKINDPSIWRKADEFILVGDGTKEHAAYVASLKGEVKQSPKRVAGGMPPVKPGNKPGTDKGGTKLQKGQSTPRTRVGAAESKETASKAAYAAINIELKKLPATATRKRLSKNLQHAVNVLAEKGSGQVTQFTQRYIKIVHGFLEDAGIESPASKFTLKPWQRRILKSTAKEMAQEISDLRKEFDAI